MLFRSALFPIGIFLGIMIIGGISHFVFGYRYVPMVADHFNDDVALVSKHLAPGTTLYILDNDCAYNFFEIMDDRGEYVVENQLPETLPTTYATLGKQDVTGEITNIITSPKSHNSDRIYIYSTSREKE